MLLDAYLYRGSNGQYSLLTFDWSTQHGFNVGAVIGFFVAFSFVMTVITPLLRLMVEFMMLPPWWFSLLFVVIALILAFEVGIPFLGAIFVVLATAPTWQEVARFFRDEQKERGKWRAPEGYVFASDYREYAYKNEKVFFMDRIDKHDAAKRAGPDNQLPRLAAGFVVTVIINALVGYSGRATMVWQLFKWSSGLSENLQGVIQIAAIVFGLVIFLFVAQLFRSRLEPDWMYCPQLAEEMERERQKERERQARFEREAQYRRSSTDGQPQDY